MANSEHLMILRRGVRYWNWWREQNPNIKPNPSQANLSGINLAEINFKDANLEEANFEEANLAKANLTKGNLKNANLKNANISQVKLETVNLEGVNLEEAITSIAKEIVSSANQATIVLEQNNYQTALDAYSKALKIAQEEKRERLVAVILNRIGNTFQNQGEIQDAVIAYETALQALESEDKFKIDSVVGRLSQVSKGFYNNPEAIPTLYSSIKVAEALEAEEKYYSCI